MQSLEAAEKWESISCLLIDKRKYHIERGEDLNNINNDQLYMVKTFLKADGKQNIIYSNAVVDTCIKFNNLTARDEVLKFMKRLNITKFLRKQKWRFALTIAKSDDARVFLYNSLREVSTI